MERAETRGDVRWLTWRTRRRAACGETRRIAPAIRCSVSACGRVGSRCCLCLHYTHVLVACAHIGGLVRVTVAGTGHVDVWTSGEWLVPCIGHETEELMCVLKNSKRVQADEYGTGNHAGNGVLYVLSPCDRAGPIPRPQASSSAAPRAHGRYRRCTLDSNNRSTTNRSKQPTARLPSGVATRAVLTCVRSRARRCHVVWWINVHALHLGAPVHDAAWDRGERA